jgi:hypothetical protein
MWIFVYLTWNLPITRSASRHLINMSQRGFARSSDGRGKKRKVGQPSNLPPTQTSQVGQGTGVQVEARYGY